MPLDLPPIALIRCDDQMADLVYAQLTSIMAGHAGATTTYYFYEALDAWLGPWGVHGYPIDYGKRYNVAFTSNARLMGNPNTRQWVWRTTISLQEALRDYVVARVRNGSIGSITESELRTAAFNSHPRAYDRGGLATAMMTAPELIAVIATIPGAEYVPFTENFPATVRQIFQTIGLTAPQVAGGALAAMAGPAHTGLFSTAMRRDRQRNMHERYLSDQLGYIRTCLDRGDLDHIPWLDALIARLNSEEFPDQGFAMHAARLIDQLEARRLRVRAAHDRIFDGSPRRF